MYNSYCPILDKLEEVIKVIKCKICGFYNRKDSTGFKAYCKSCKIWTYLEEEPKEENKK
jgi:hypothetical protein